MTALSDALAAAQSRAVAALGKQYVGGQMDDDELRAALDAIGLTDPADTAQWLAALNIIQTTGAALPREKPAGTGRTADEGAGARSDRHAQSGHLRLAHSPVGTRGGRGRGGRLPEGVAMSGDPYPKSSQLARGDKRYVRKVASPKQWQAIIAAKRGPCRVCGSSAWGVEYHHLVQRIHGGGDVADNIVPLCRVDHAMVTGRVEETGRRLLASLSDAEYAYLIQQGGEDYPERAYGIEYRR